MHFRVQDDGNLVVYDKYNKPHWASNTSSPHGPFIFRMQGDGNLVLYDKHDKPVWASNTCHNVDSWEKNSNRRYDG